PAYVSLREADSENSAEVRKYVLNLWKRYAPYAERNFVAQFACQTQQRYWEMYLACCLLDIGMRIRTHPDGPDIEIQDHQPKIWIEATVPTPGEKGHPDAVTDLLETSRGVMRRVPVEQILLRFASAFDTKQRQISTYRGRGLVADDDVCIIAISGGAIGSFSTLNGDMPFIVKLLFGIGNRYIEVDSSQLGIVGSGHEFKGVAIKSNAEPISLAPFRNSAYKFVSAVLYTSQGIGNSPARLGDDLVVIHNPLANVRLARGIISRGSEVWQEIIEGNEMLCFGP
ncbi:hypothetical protein, partial [Hypericibacter sp.]|uniref:hypothetical protein n=1 Tax=Hypericibacter sp. TaxID=2705401 RepID=UPI003D6D4202